ncbi:hypothetical protein [Peribacillus frigoritolerans]|uniref:hypothetical protein n=1 Tax=Peribacillus frigoritolerans TaxID=450367 RepID=UPI001059B692|nr:hypothetical protein [Peribacillus frigoritolerans]TDL80656.1 hypothetical protein E2R53_11665 [Peribacillus frigoritolerans]
MLSEKRQYEESGDFFSSFMFGNKRERSIEQKEAERTPAPDEQEPQSEPDFFQLFMQIDNIMDSLKELKPVVKEFSPILDYFKQKLK